MTIKKKDQPTAYSSQTSRRCYTNTKSGFTKKKKHMEKFNKIFDERKKYYQKKNLARALSKLKMKKKRQKNRMKMKRTTTTTTKITGVSMDKTWTTKTTTTTTTRNKILGPKI